MTRFGVGVFVHSFPGVWCIKWGLNGRTSVGHGYCRAEVECVVVFRGRLTADCIVVEYFVRNLT
jgi:hypothetical protein